ncbi:hypothetical protein V6N11_000392 [Hibiscus sabdariffa]|uniref:Uncharacterized protein n=2 Tax=Hibiscus sabdariffa TaxID=183260 RepID=A0ABR2NSW2_9ROSI
MKMKLPHAFYKDPIGTVGGLALWWNDDASVNILKSGKNFIDTRLSIKGEAEWFGTFIYGSPYAEKKQQFWKILSRLRDNNNDRIVVSLEWDSVFSQAIGVMDTSIALDHSPIILLLNGIKKKGKRGFNFESKWLLERRNAP